MNTVDQARMAYTSHTAPIRTERGTEYDAFARVTGAMRQAISRAESDFPALVSALHRNRALWTTLAANVADSDNRLPDRLRAQVFYLAEFTDRHTSTVLRRGASAEVLVEINQTVMQGLRSGEAPE